MNISTPSNPYTIPCVNSNNTQQMNVSIQGRSYGIGSTNFTPSIQLDPEIKIYIGDVETTGQEIMNIIKILREAYPEIKY